MFSLQDFANLTQGNQGLLGGVQAAPTQPSYSAPVAQDAQGYSGMGVDPFSQATNQAGLASMYSSGARAMNGQQFDLPTADTGSKAPTYSTAGIGTAAMDPALRATLTAGGQGTMAQGVNAFLGSSYTPYTQGGTSGEGGFGSSIDNSQQLFNLAKSIGYDTTGYTNDPAHVNMLYSNLNDKLKDYYNVNGLSSGWTGSGDPRGASSTMYIKQGDQLIPTNWGSNGYSAPTSSSINRASNMEQLAALSSVLPVFGGVGGILGAGTAGTLSAGAGLGLTNGLASAIGTGATNALVNAGTSYALSGGQGGMGSVLGSLGGSLAGAAGNSLLGNQNGLGSMFNTAGAGAMGSSYNPYSGFNSMAGSYGLGGLSPYTSLFGAMGGGGINAQNLTQAGAGLAGGYLGQQLDPRLRGLGSQAGSSLANLLYR